MLVYVSPPNLLNYLTETDDILCVNVFLSVDLNPIKKIRARSLFLPKIDFFENLNRKGLIFFSQTDLTFIQIQISVVEKKILETLTIEVFCVNTQQTYAARYYIACRVQCARDFCQREFFLTRVYKFHKLTYFSFSPFKFERPPTSINKRLEVELQIPYHLKLLNQ